MPQAGNFDFFYTEDSGLTFQEKDVHAIEHQLNKDFGNLSKWPVRQ